MTKIKQASTENIKRIEQAWETNKVNLFLRNGTAPDGSIGQDFLHNEPLRNTIDAIAKSYIPIAARKLELRELRNKMGQSGNSNQTEMQNIKNEMEAVDARMIVLNNNAIKKLGSENSGFEKEQSRYNNQDPRETAIKLLGSMFVTFVRGINSHAIMPGDGFFPPRFQ